MKIPYIDLSLQHKALKNELMNEIGSVLDSGQFIMGDQVARFEKTFAEIAGTTYALGVANGTDAIFLPFRALGIGNGDEVITAPNSFLASASSVVLAGATPVFADVTDDFNLDPAKLEKAITPRTKAVLVVHLTGRPANMDAIVDICKKNGLHLLEDCAQAVGASVNGKPVGSFGIAGCFSLHPLKNLSACGDGGVITTNDKTLYEYLVKARNHGLKNRDECEFWSYNSRLDALQAAILNVKLTKLKEWNDKRKAIAERYNREFKDLNFILPVEAPNTVSVYHTYIIQTAHRDALKNYLAEKGIDTKIHYPVPIHLQEAAASLGYKKGDFPVTERQAETILSLPVYPELSEEQLTYICNTVKAFKPSEKNVKESAL